MFDSRRGFFSIYSALISLSVIVAIGLFVYNLDYLREKFSIKDTGEIPSKLQEPIREHSKPPAPKEVSPPPPPGPPPPQAPSEPITKPPTSSAPPAPTNANIYDFGFDNGTFGSFVTGNSKNPTTIGWQFDSTDFAKGANSVKRKIPVNSANQGYAFYYLLSQPQKSLYVRFAYKQGPNFDNSNPIKVLRFLAPGFGTQLGTLMFNANTSNLVQVNPDQIQGSSPSGGLSPNTGNPAKTPNQTRGEWHWYEFFADFNTSNSIVYKVWQDDVLIIDGVIARPSLGPVGTIQIDGTFNAINTAEDVWYDSIGVSTERMGIPSP